MVDHELEELRREFLAGANEKVREIEAALKGERTAESMERLTYLVHQLKGAGGSYGYARISDDAAELEKAFDAIDRTAGVRASDEERIRRHVVNLRVEIERGRRALKLERT